MVPFFRIVAYFCIIFLSYIILRINIFRSPKDKLLYLIKRL